MCQLGGREIGLRPGESSCFVSAPFHVLTSERHRRRQVRVQRSGLWVCRFWCGVASLLSSLEWTPPCCTGTWEQDTWEQGRGPARLCGSPDPVPASLRNRRDSEFPHSTRREMPTQKSKAMRSIKPSLRALRVCKNHLARWLVGTASPDRSQSEGGR